VGFDLSASQWVLLLLIAVLIFGTNRLKRSGDGLHSQLRKEMGRMPVYSAETTNHREAEFIRDRLPKRFPTLVVAAVALVTLTVLVWWLAG
jgi:Sec-independent protein translocase protein TatA